MGAGIALTTLTLPAGEAAAETSASCDAARSRRLITNNVLGSGENKLWIDSQSPTRTVVCFALPVADFGSGAIVVDVATGPTPPSVDPGDDPLDCSLVALTQADPVPFEIGYSIAATTVCLTIADKTLTLDFDTGSVSGLPTLEVWRDGTFGALDIAACAVQYTLWSLGEGPDSCMTSGARIV